MFLSVSVSEGDGKEKKPFLFFTVSGVFEISNPPVLCDSLTMIWKVFWNLSDSVIA